MADQVDRSVFFRCAGPFAGVVNRTLAGSQPDWNILASPKAPEGAPNVLVVLVDDAGSATRARSVARSRRRTLTRLADEACATTAFHVTALCSPTRAALLTGRNHHSVGFGSIGEFAGGLPRLLGVLSEGLGAVPADPAGERLQHGGVRQVAPDPGPSAGPGRPVRPLAERLGFDYFWGFLGGEAGQYDPVITENQTTIGVAGATTETYYLPDEMADKTIEWLHGVRAQDADKPWFVYYSTGCATRRTTCRRSGATSTRASSTRAGTRYREQTFARQKQLGVIPADAELTPRNDAFPAWDSLPDDAEAALRAPDGGLRRASRRTPTGTSAGSWTRSRRWASSTTPWSSTSAATTAPAWKAPSPARSTS